MKRITIIAVFVTCGLISNGQNPKGSTTPNKESAPVGSKKVSLEERINKQEQEVKMLKSDNQKLKKELQGIRSGLPLIKKTITVSRAGSKQVNIE